MPDQPAERFGFTKLLVTDLEASLAFYSAVFGFSESSRVQAEIADRPIDEIILSSPVAGAPTLILLRYADVTTVSSAEVILGFITSDADALVARALAAGGSVVRAPDLNEHAGGMRVGFIADNEGHLIELVETAT